MILGMLFLVVPESSFAVTVITLDTNKSSYGPGDLVVLTGKIPNSPNQLVAIEVKDSSGNPIIIRTVQTGVAGNFVLKFKIPSTAKSGNYNIIANAKVGEDTIKQIKTITAASVVPEFPLNSGLIIMMALVITIGITMTIRLKVLRFQA